MEIPLYSWLPTESYHEKIAIKDFFFSKSDEFGPLFMKYPLHRMKSYISS
jgi:hypothetical protein